LPHKTPDLSFFKATILALVNTINTGEEHEEMGFSLDALLKLSEVKAFDKRTSVLQYLVKLVKQNDKSLCDVKSDLSHVAAAENILLDSIFSELQNLRDDLDRVHKTAAEEAERLGKEGKPPTLQELKERRTEVTSIDNVAHFNKVEHLNGRTSMERFSLQACSTLDKELVHADTVKQKYARLIEYFGEKPDMPCNEFFGTLKRFVAEFGVTLEHVEKEEKKKEKERKRVDKASPKGLSGVSPSDELKLKPLRPTSQSRDPSPEVSELIPGSIASIAALAAAAVVRNGAETPSSDQEPKPLHETATEPDLTIGVHETAPSALIESSEVAGPSLANAANASAKVAAADAAMENSLAIAAAAAAARSGDFFVG
jgi:Formin Homology 2 Domain